MRTCSEKLVIAIFDKRNKSNKCKKKTKTLTKAI